MKKINTMANLGLLLVILVVLIGLLAQVAQAAALTSLSDTMSTVKASTAANHEIKFTSPTGIAAGQTVTYTFNTFTGVSALLFSDVDFATSNAACSATPTFTEQTLAATPSGTTWGVATSTTVITITSGTGTSAAGNCIRLRVGTNAVNQSTGVNQITNPAASSPTITMAGTFGDTGTITVNIIANDAVAVSGTVNQTLTFSISTSTIAFGTLDSAAARYASTTTSGSASDLVAHTLAISTNSISGYTITVKGATLTIGAGPTPNITAIGATPATSAPGTEQFGIYATKAGGVNGTIAAPYATASSFGYDATVSTSTTFASGSTATATETYSLHYLANITATTEAGSYTASLTYVATGNF